MNEVTTLDTSRADVLERPSGDPMAAARAAKAAKREREKLASAEQGERFKLVPGRKISERARAAAELAAAVIPNDMDELRAQERAQMLLKATQPTTYVRIVAARRGSYVSVRTVNAGTKAAYVEDVIKQTNPEALNISGDDLAEAMPGACGKKFRIGELAHVTLDAAERLCDQGFAEPA